MNIVTVIDFDDDRPYPTADRILQFVILKSGDMYRPYVNLQIF